MKKAKIIIIGVIWTIVGLYILLVTMLHVPAFQSYLGQQIGEALTEKFGTQVSVGRIDLGFLSRVIIDDVSMDDQDGKNMLKASRVSAKIDILPLLRGEVSISSAQLFGAQGTFYKKSELAQPNFQFALDSLASKDTTQHTPLNLHIGSLVVRHSGFTYDRWDRPQTNGQFNADHLDVKDLSIHLLLPHLTEKSVEATLKRMSFSEGSGFNVKNLSFKLIADTTKVALTSLDMELPNSKLNIDSIGATYEMSDGKVKMPTLRYGGHIDRSKITFADLACFDRQVESFETPVYVETSFSGTGNMLQVQRLTVDSEEGELNLDASGSVSSNNRWFARIQQLQLSAHTIELVKKNLQRRDIQVPAELTRLGDISFQGEVGGSGKNVSMKGIVNTDAGDARLGIGLHDNHFSARLETDGINLKRILDDPKFGILASQINVDGDTNFKEIKALGTISRFDYQNYSYQNLDIDGKLNGNLLDGHFSIKDPHADIELDGSMDVSKHNSMAKITAKVRNFSPYALHLINDFKDKTFSLDLDANLSGHSLSTLVGTANVSNLEMASKDDIYQLNALNVVAEMTEQGHVIHLNSDFGSINVTESDNFRKANADAVVTKGDWLNAFFGIPVEIDRPVYLSGNRNADANTMDFKADLPQFSFNGIKMDFTVDAQQKDGKITSLITWDDKKAKPFKGKLNCTTEMFKNERGKQVVHARVHESSIIINDTTWYIRPSDIVYSDKHLTVDYFSIDNNEQHLTIYGMATPNPEDILTVELQDIDVAYILNLVNFHVVKFDGLASGKASIRDIYGKMDANADLTVRNFHFQDGLLGTLYAKAHYDNDTKQIDIDAHADDPLGTLLINGYISPARNYLDLALTAKDTRMDFVESFCSSFMRNTNVRGNGDVHLLGFLSGENSINLSGLLRLDGSVEISPLNTKYTLRNDLVRMVPNEIYFDCDTVYDRRGNIGIVRGAVHHQRLSKITFDFDVEAHNFLAYDFPDYNGASFFGTVYGTGNCAIKGRSGRIDFDVNATPEKGSFIEYDAARPDAIANQEFIEWRDVTQPIQDSTMTGDVQCRQETPRHNTSSDMHMNFLFNTSPENFTLRLLMDKRSGDYISLNGSGTLRASYYNKGSFDMFGTYLIDHGIYKLTIQNVIKKDFLFQPGSTLVFGGDPNNAALNLKALYTVNGASLSDLQIGNSFKNNNVRVDCMMNINGTANAPRVDFDLDLPTLGTDAKQMVRSLINSEEEMNQQVIYLLAIGRFYVPNDNNAAEQQSQTSLAMQSFLSGTVSQQMSNVLSSLTNNSNWNIGANISTGDEGWNNAEYEGILSGKLLNNRLLFNGQFGYRDNAEKATSSFIGDFDLRYLLYPNGNLAVRVYNQTNDRYFTRNSLNTQGIGIILKKDFNTLKDLFGKGKK